MSGQELPREVGRSRPRLLDWRALIGIAISVVLLYLAFRKMDLRAVFAQLRAVEPLTLLLATAFATSVFWIRAWRWKSILQPVRAGIPFRSRFASVTIGFMGNNLLPARIGEFLRAYALSRLERVTFVGSFASLVIERFLDGLVMVSFLFIAMALPSFPEVQLGDGSNYPAIALGVGIFIGVAALMLLALVLFPRPAVAFMERAVMILPLRVRRPIIDALEAFLTGVGILRDPLLLLRAGGWSIVLWLVNAAGFHFAFRAFGIELPFAAALFFQSCIAIAVSVPSGPAFVGVYHGAAMAVLYGIWGVDQTRSAAFAIGFHLAGFIPVTAIGLYYAWRIGLSVGEAKASEEVIETAVERETGSDRVIDPAPPP